MSFFSGETPPSHEGHDHLTVDANLLAQIVEAVDDAQLITNLFVLFVPADDEDMDEERRPARFVIVDVNRNGRMRVIGAIPFSYMLDISVGFTRAVQNVLVDPTTAEPREYDAPEQRPTVGPFKVL